LVRVIILVLLFSGFIVACPKVISLAPSVTETIEYLGKGDCIIATTVYSEDGRKKIGGLIDPDIEEIIKLKPDIVISSTLTPKDRVKALKRAGIKVVVLRWDTLGDIEKNIRIIGKLLGVKNAERRAELFRKSLRFTRNVRGNALIFVGCKELIVAGKGTYLSDIFEMNGFRNLAYRGGWYRINLEYVHRVKPDFVFAFCDLNIKLPDRTRLVKITSKRLLRPSPYVVEAVQEIGRLAE